MHRNIQPFISIGAPMTFDLQLIQEPAQALTGFFAAGPYRQRCARGREEDSLFLLIQPRNEGFMSAAELAAWQESLANTYFRSQGSVTMAMRALLGEIDSQVKERNQTLDTEIPAHVLDVFLGVVHHGTLFGAQTGKVYCVHLKASGMQVFHETWADDSPLGLLSAFESRFFQTGINEGDLLIVAPNLPLSWLETTSQGMTNNLRSLANNLNVLSRGSHPLQAMRLRIGVGQVTELNIAEHLNKEKATAVQLREEAREAELKARNEATLKAEAEKVKAAALKAEQQAREVAVARTQLLSLPAEEDLTEASETVPPAAAEEKPAFKISSLLERIKKKSESEEALPSPILSETPPAQKFADGPTEISQGTIKGIAAGAGWMRSLEEKTKHALDKPVLDRDGVPTPISGLSVMNKLLIAIIVPLVIVAFAVGIYLSKGITTQYERLMNQARGAVASAQSAKTQDQQRDNWQTAFTWLAQAETYKSSEELVQMKSEAQRALDSLTGAVQLTFTKILSSAQSGSDARLTQVASVGNDLFTLDLTSGKVLHMTRDEKGYLFDPAFNCGEGQQQGKMLGKLVAITLIPLTNKHEAPLLALDSAGNAAFCKPGSEAAVITLIAPEGGWGSIQKIHYDANNGRLYVFDPLKNGLWIYTGYTDEFPKAPIPFFDNPSFALNDVIDFVINRDESFYLFRDGHSAHCLSSSVTGTVDCQNPIAYIDPRPGKEGQQLNDLKFSHLNYAPSPDASIYYLDPKDASLYQFSLKLNLNDVKRAAAVSPFNFSKGVTALGMANDRIAYLAFGPDLYASPLP
jgi:hypothetical protein